ncbi:MAG: hypothetical protein AAB583_02875 [Patescibacteria group bacterium]
MKETVNGYKHLELSPRHIFADRNGYESFAYNDLGKMLSGLDACEAALQQSNMSVDLRKQEEDRQRKRWTEASRQLCSSFQVPSELIDKEDVLRQFRYLSQKRVNKLSKIGRITQDV